MPNIHNTVPACKLGTNIKRSVLRPALCALMLAIGAPTIASAMPVNPGPLVHEAGAQLAVSDDEAQVIEVGARKAARKQRRAAKRERRAHRKAHRAEHRATKRARKKARLQRKKARIEHRISKL